MKKQQGFLLIAALILLVLFAVVLGVISHLTVNASSGSEIQTNSIKAEQLASTAMQTATGSLVGTEVSNRETCDGLSPTYSNTSFGGGAFSLSGIYYTTSKSGFPPTTPTTLPNSISASATIIPLNASTGYAPFGQVMIDKELIDYTSIGTSSGDCGGSNFCLLGVTRGINNSTAESHPAGTVVSQNQCSVTASSGVPNLTSPESSSNIQAQVVGIPQGWITGNAQGEETYLLWNGKTWTRVTSTILPNIRQNAISAVSYSDVWGVGQRNGGTALITHWNGNVWSRVYPSQPTNQHMYSISCVNGDFCAIVGKGAAILKWNGITWENERDVGLVDTTTTSGFFIKIATNKALRSISCSSPDYCWAVGDNSAGANMVFWNGIVWSRANPNGLFSPFSEPASQNLYGVSCPSSGTCWAVGDPDGNKLNIEKWDGAYWSRVYPSENINSRLTSISCTSNDNCWAVGKKIGGDALIMHGIGNTWTRVYPTTTNNQDLLNVSCNNANNCWAVGTNSAIAHWNGTNWQWVASPINTTLRAVEVIGPVQQEPKFWQVS